MITEKDLFYYVWYPNLLTPRKSIYIEEHQNEFYEPIQFLIDCYFKYDGRIDKKLLADILKRIHIYQQQYLEQN